MGLVHRGERSGTPSRSGRTGRRTPATPGLRRVSWVRVVIGSETVRAEAVGTAHRLPVTVPISMESAAALAREGVPLSVVHDGDDTE